MAYISESICKISKQRQDNYNDYYFYPQNNANFKKEAFEDKIVIVKIFNANKQLIDEFNINVNTFGNLIYQPKYELQQETGKMYLKNTIILKFLHSLKDILINLI